MALQGEGDPRWVVRERQDGRNVNGWHWEDKDVSGWAQDRIKELLSGEKCRAVGADGMIVAVEKVESVDGDATLYNRKGVLKVLYDLKVAGTWTSEHDEKEDRTHGDFKFELFDEDPEVLVSMDGKCKKVHAYKELFSTKIRPMIQEQCRIFIKELHSGANQSVDGLSVPTKKTAVESKVTDYLRSGMKQGEKVGEKKKKWSSLIMKDEFTCSPEDLYLGLTERRRMEAITRGKVISESCAGGKLDLMNGTVVGEYVELQYGSSLKMKWKLKRWAEEAEMADVSIRISEEDGKSKLEVKIDGVEDSEKAGTEGFWRVQILQAMKVVMGWGNASQFL